MFRLLQNVLNLSEINLRPESDIIFFGNQNFANIILLVSIRLSADKSSIFLMTGTYCDSLQYKGRFVMKCEHVCASNFPWFGWNVMMNYLFL